LIINNYSVDVSLVGLSKYSLSRGIRKLRILKYTVSLMIYDPLSRI